MKLTHIIGILVIGVAILIIVSTAGDASTYVNFAEAKSLASKGNKTKIHVVGKLKKDENGEVVGIENGSDMMSFVFLMVDENQQEQRVIYNDPMPADFLRSEQVVVIGAYANSEIFLADKILMKCPSKYQEETVAVN